YREALLESPYLVRIDGVHRHRQHLGASERGQRPQLRRTHPGERQRVEDQQHRAPSAEIRQSYVLVVLIFKYEIRGHLADGNGHNRQHAMSVDTSDYGQRHTLADMAGGARIGIDFGTSHTVALIAWPDGRVRPLLFDGSPVLPSSVYAQPDGRLLVGR